MKYLIFDRHWVKDNKQLLNKAEHDIKNYPDRAQCYLPKAEADNIERGLDNSWYHT